MRIDFRLTNRHAFTCGLLSLLALMTVMRSHGQVPAPQVLMFDGGNGAAAELSNYSLTEYGQNTSGRFQGKFCFELANTSLAPYRIGAVGLMNSQFLLIASSSSARFTGLQFELDFGFQEVSVAFIADAFPESLLFALPSGERAAFCMTISHPQQFDLNFLVNNLVLLFADTPDPNFGGPLWYGRDFVGKESPSGNRARASVSTIKNAADETCFSVFNEGDKVITGIAFEFPNTSGPFTLVSVDPLPGADDHNLRYASPLIAGPGLNSYHGKVAAFYDFGFISDRALLPGYAPFGLAPGERFSFCLAESLYDFSELFLSVRTVVLFQGHDIAETDFFNPALPAGSLRGVVATNPR